MYKDLSLKEKAKVLLYGGKLGLTSVEDIAKLYDDAIGHKFLGDTESQMNNSSGVLKWNEELLDFVYSVPEVTVAYDLPKRNENKKDFDRYVQSITNSYINGNINTNDVNKLPWLYRNAIIGLSNLSKGLEMTKSYNQKVREEFRELSNIPNKKKIKRSWLKTVYGDNRDYNDIPAAIDNIAEAEKYNTEVLKKEKQLDNWLSSNAGKLLNAYIPFFDPFKGDMTDMPSQAYRYYLRHFKNDDEYISGNGTDIVSLNDNVIRLTPTSNQSTALFNEFVERANPSVRKASDYKNNNTGTFGDRNIPIQNISLYQGIENGVFKVAPIEQFNDSTDVYPVRNIRKAFSAPIKNIDVSFDVNPTYPNSAGINSRTRLEYRKISNDYKTTFNEIALDNIDNLIEEAKLIKDTKLVDKLLDFKKTGKYKSFYGLEYDLSDLPSYSNISDKAFSETKSLNKQYFEQIDNELILLNSIFQEKQKQYPSLFRDDFGTYTWYYNDIKDKLGKYNVTDVNDSTYNISNLNAAILDNKMVLGNPNGGVFIGKFLDISKPQLDSLNAYLLKNPSWLARPDLGSFDQYRLDSPSLGSYLRQYFEHPDQNDPNVFVVGTTQPNKLWSNSYAKGGPIVTPHGQWKYPGRDTIIPSNSITMDYVDYPVLGISDTGDTKVMMPWNDYKFRGSVVYEHPLIGNQFQLGGNTKPTFDLWYPTVPKQKNDASSYDLRRAYNMLPFEEMEKFRTIDDYHLPSVAYDEKTDTYTFLKRNGHPTLNYELDWYNSGTPDALEFRERYKLDTLSLPWRYIPTYAKGGSIHIKPENRGKFTALKKRTGHSASWFKAHGTPALRKMATFELNARHWKHLDGGYSDRLNNLNWKMHHSAGSDNIGSVWYNYTFDPENNYYNGTHYVGQNLLGKTQEQLPLGRDHVNLYTYGDETGFERINNATPITVNGETYDYRLYYGNILPFDTIYLKPESLPVVDSMIKHKDLFGVNTDYFIMDLNDAETYPKQYKNVFSHKNIKKGMPLDDTRAVSISPKKDENGYYLDAFDVIDYKKTTGFAGNRLDKIVERENILNGPYILRQRVPVVFDKNKESNGPLLNLISQYKDNGMTWEEYLIKYSPLYNKTYGRHNQDAVNIEHKRKYGGHLYSEGGFLLVPYLYNE